MKLTLEKYFLKKWWLPILLVLVICILFIIGIKYNNSILRPISKIFLYIAIVIAVISCFWQFLNGKWYLAILQFIGFLILIGSVLSFEVIVAFNRIDNKLSNSQSSNPQEISSLIKKKTDLELENNFIILKDDIKHTEGAFDSDYSYELIIKYQDFEKHKIKNQILNSILFDTTNTRYNPKSIWKIINSKTDKGIWTYSKYGFEFLHCDNDKNRPEPFYIRVDTLTNRIELNLMHL